MLDWDGVELDALADEIRSDRPGPGAERTIWAFAECLRIARLDPELLPYLLAAAACFVARRRKLSAGRLRGALPPRPGAGGLGALRAAARLSEQMT